MIQDQKIKRGHSSCTRRRFGLALGATSIALTATAGKMIASNTLKSDEVSREESLQLALRAIGSHSTKAAAENLSEGVVNSATLNLHLRNTEVTADNLMLIANAFD